MSHITIYKIESNGDVIPFEDINNSHKTLMTIWDIMFRTYNDTFQDKLDRPDWLPESEDLDFTTIQITNQMEPFWNLFKNDDIIRNDRLVFGMTFDKAIIKYENLPELTMALSDFIVFYSELFNSIDFSGLTRMFHIFKEITSDKDCLGLCMCISQIASFWTISDEDSDKERPYNIFTSSTHWDVFKHANIIDNPKPKIKIYLDDDREHRKPEDDSWVRLYSYDEFVSYIEANGLPDVISFDHDLGESEGIVSPTGKDCANWLVANCLENDSDLPEYRCHSGNPIGKDNIIGLLDNYVKFRQMNK